MECLNCDQELIQHTIRTTDQEVRYFLCPTCESLWLPKGQLDRMADQVEGSVELSTRTDASADVNPSRPCPSCQAGPMKTVHFLEYSDVLLNYCEHCEGFWLDEHELDEINEELNKIMDVREKGFADFIAEIHRPYWRHRIRDDQQDVPDEEGQEAPQETDQPQFRPLRNAEWIESTDMSCAACGSSLERYDAFDIKLEGCSSCYGLWLNDDELRQLKDRAEGDRWTDLQWVDDELEALESSYGMPSRRDCPECTDQKLVTVQFGSSRIHLDLCPNCNGTWLDAGEFQQIMEHLKKQVVELTPGEATERLRHELAEVVSGPEGPLSELQDAKAAASTLLTVSFYKNPQLRDTLMSISSLFG
jgi:Zn-finger nucleic acid-binding protein